MTWNFWKTNCSSVWVRSGLAYSKHCCRWGDWRMETTSPGLCPWNGGHCEHLLQ